MTTPGNLAPNEKSILICPNAFKGSATAAAAASAIARGLRSAWRHAGAARQLPCRILPVADGGDGTLDTLVASTGGAVWEAHVHDPLGRPMLAAWGRLGGDRATTAIIEMARASGLALLRPEELDPLGASTRGTGELMLEAVRSGCRTLIVAIGGSATTDGGAGMAQALGVRLLDERGHDLPPGGAALERLHDLDLSGYRIPADVKVVVACDVDNPLTGPRGASAVYGPQKGAGPDEVAVLERGLSHWCEALEKQTRRRIGSLPGAGAAGGLGAGLIAICGAALRPGADLVLDLIRFDAHLQRAALVVTGEGSLDAQTGHGKVVLSICRRARKAGVPAAALAGRVDSVAEVQLRREGLTLAMPIVDGPLSLPQAMQRTPELLEAAAYRLMRAMLLWHGSGVDASG